MRLWHHRGLPLNSRYSRAQLDDACASGLVTMVTDCSALKKKIRMFCALKYRMQFYQDVKQDRKSKTTLKCARHGGSHCAGQWPRKRKRHRQGPDTEGLRQWLPSSTAANPVKTASRCDSQRTTPDRRNAWHPNTKRPDLYIV